MTDPHRDVPDVISELVGIVGGGHVLVEPDRRAAYETDWTRRWTGLCDAVVRPGSTGEVVAVVRWALRRGVTVVPQGGNTGLVGGAVPRSEGGRPVVVLSTRRLDGVGPVDAVAGQITAGAGCTLGTVCDAVAGTGWDVGVDLGARDTATVGGMVATNAGGTRVVRHGMMRRNVVGLEVVLGDGSVVSRLGGLEKDNTGYDLTGLMCGSEGTLGVVTAVRLRLVPERRSSFAVLVGCSDWSDAVELARDCRLGVPGVEALEALDDSTVHVVERAFGLVPPVRAPVVVLAEVDESSAEALGSLVAGRPHAVAPDPASVARLWRLRDRATEAIATTGVPHKCDVTLPLDRLATFAEEIGHLGGDELAVHLFGHVGDGNLHVNLVGPADDDDRLDGEVLRLVAAHGGSISAEHGIGRAKRSWLHLSRSPAEIAAFRSLKAALDPGGVMNPGVLLPD